MDELLAQVVLGQEVRAWLIAGSVSGAAVVVALTVRWVAGVVLRARLARVEQRAEAARLAREADPDSDEAVEAATAPSAPQLEFAVQLIQSFVFPALIIGGLAVGSRTLTLPEGVASIVNAVFVVLFSLVVIRFLTAVLNELFRRAARQTDKIDLTRIRPLRSITVFVVWIAGLLFLLDNLGFDVTAIVAGLGITGIAVALAAQAVLGDLFSYFVILFDRPFEIGDFIIAGEVTGSVERIGVKTTKIRAMGGEQIVVGNSALTGGSLRNFKRLEQRLVVVKLSVEYGTSLEHLQQIPEIIGSVIKRESEAEFLRVHFSEYAESGLTFDVLYRVLSPDFVLHMDIKQRINLGIYEEFGRHGIGFALPVRTVRMQSESRGT